MQRKRKREGEGEEIEGGANLCDVIVCESSILVTRDQKLVKRSPHCSRHS